VELRADEDWMRLIRMFEGIISSRLKNRLVRIIARSSPNDLIYESNVVVVVDKADIEVIREVGKAALEAMEKTGVEGLNPITISEGDKVVEDMFRSKVREEIVGADDWMRLIRMFEGIISSRLKNRLVRIIARSSPNDLIYESNVVVVVDKADIEVIREVGKAALEAMEKTGVEGLNPITISKWEMDEFR